MPYFNSSAIRHARYDTTANRMWITFTSSFKEYEFCGVPQDVYDGLLSASSVGQYYDNYIRDKYQC